MDIEDIKDIEAGLPQWEFLQQLPKELEGFTLVSSTGIKGQVLNLATYVNEAKRVSLELTYTAETFDYVPVRNIGLHSFRDIRYFFRKKEDFAAALMATDRNGDNALARLLRSMNREPGSFKDWEYDKLEADRWEYGMNLPKQIGNYELYITPDNPVEFITGSVIFLDYTDFERGNQLYFVYNAYRNEIYAGEKVNNKPQTTNLFTVPEENKHGERITRSGRAMARDLVVPTGILLPWLREKMEQHLQSELEALQKTYEEIICKKNS